MVVVGAYLNSFAGVFLFDDYEAILLQPGLGRWWPDTRALAVDARPLTTLTFAADRALHGEAPAGYHAVNLAVHVSAALALFGLIRRSLTAPRVPARYGPMALPLALTAALLWAVHPLQTESVTYVVQRAESLMGLWYILVLYALRRSIGSVRRGVWEAVAIGACALGMASKPVMVTAPIAALLYDRSLLAASWRDLWQRRARLYLGLAATWTVLSAVLLIAPAPETATAGYGVQSVTPLVYLRSQAVVILHYLRLILWPTRLCLDYLWPPAMRAGEWLPTGFVVGAILGAVAWAWRTAKPLGFVAVFFFLVLVPTSSVIPLTDLAAEHRLYLPLASAAIAAVLAGEWALRRLAPKHQGRLFAAVATGLVLALAGATIARNATYHSRAGMWSDVVAKRPDNPRARQNLGLALWSDGRLAEAEPHLRAAVRLRPHRASLRQSYATLLEQLGRHEEASAEYELAAEQDDAERNVLDHGKQPAPSESRP